MIEITENGIVEILTENGEEFIIDMATEEIIFCGSNDIGLNSNPEFNRVLIYLEGQGINL